jgi:hypothetical protein
LVRTTTGAAVVVVGGTVVVVVVVVVLVVVEVDVDASARRTLRRFQLGWAGRCPDRPQ